MLKGALGMAIGMLIVTLVGVFVVMGHMPPVWVFILLYFIYLPIALFICKKYIK
ncbi:MAG: hypothetical protein LBH10_01820 [Burkholderiaceae bacterium]|nr:hypothetical protein [Burkholderiaceae bacterium]